MELNNASKAFAGISPFSEKKHHIIRTIIPRGMVSKYEEITHGETTDVAINHCKRLGVKWTTYKARRQRGLSIALSLDPAHIGRLNKAK